MTIPTFTKQTHFRDLSECAATKEHQGNYQEAANFWNQAYKVARKIQNKEWCLNRSEFCERMADRPFSSEGNQDDGE